MNTFSAGLRRGPISPSTLALLVLGALLTFMAASPQAAFGASYVVDSTADTSLTTCTGAASDCTLRGAITNANGNVGADTITFDTGVFPPGTPATIALGSALPAMAAGSDTIDASAAGVIIDGVVPLTACVDVSGTGNVVKGIQARRCFVGIYVSNSGNVIGGTGAGERVVLRENTYGVLFYGVGATGNSVIGSIIGTDAAGTGTGLGNSRGVHIESGAASNTVGGSTAAHRNIIVGNTTAGIEFNSAGAGNVVKGNYIGTNPSGTTALPNSIGINVSDAPSNTIGGTTAGERNVISGNTSDGIYISGTGATGNVVKGNYIGTNAAGTAALGNAGYGVNIIGSSDSNFIGGSTVGERNVISGNSYGVVIGSTSSSGNMIQGNFIGTNAAGTAAVANTQNAIHITGPSNTVGGVASTPGTPPGNVLSGNLQAGISVLGESADGNAIYGNLIGTDTAGTADLGNGDLGVYVLSGADGTLVGSTTAGTRNVISGNNSRGVGIFDASTTGNVVAGNYIGTNISGTALTAGTQANGVTIANGGASANTIGGSTSAHRNVISGNTGDGIKLGESGPGNSNTVQGNYVGVAADGSALGNGGHGVVVSALSISNVIGGVAAGAGNTIGNNGGDGVFVSTGDFDAIRGNSIYANTGLGIDLGTDGVTANDAGDGDSGPNNLINFPVITSASYNPVTRTLTVSGTLDTVSPLTTTVDVYGTDVPDGSGYGEGHEWLGGASPNGAGAWNLISSPVTMPPYGYLSATTTDVSANTSEFSLTFDADLDGDGFPASTDKCDTTYNPLQMDHDGDSVGDVCDGVVRNRYSASSSSVIAEYATAPGQQLHDDGRLYDPWDYNAGSGIDTGALVGTLDVTVHLGGISAPCEQGNLYNVNLINATTSMTTLVNTSSILADGDSDGLVNGVEQFPRFLTTLLDPERHSNVDDDGDGAIDEDTADGVDNDSDTKIDEDRAGTPTALHARYFGQIGGGFIQVLIIEEVPNTLYRRLVIFNDPIGPFFVGTDVCSPLEYRQTVNNNSANNPATTATEGVAAVLGSVSAGTHVFRYERIDPPDTDGDGVVNYLDDCVLVANATQVDGDSDRIGDACDPTPAVNTGSGNHDGDGYYNVVDNCPTIANASQLESERRTASPFGQYAVGDAIGDACDSDPTLVLNPAEISISRYSDAVCVTGGGVTDADADGWCGGTAAEDPDDSFATGAPVTPESATVSIGSCTNGVDDDGDASTDFADSGCADSDGDAVPDAVDICDAAADPLQLDGDGDAQGDACETENLVSLSAVSSANNASAELRHRLVEVAPGPLHRAAGIMQFADRDWNIVAGGSVANGAIRAALSAMVTASIDPNPSTPTAVYKPCNNVLPLTYTLLDASTDPSLTVSPGTGLAGLVADSDVDGLADGLELYPSFLLSLRDASSRVDNDADTARDEDPTDGFDNDQDGAVDEDPYDHITPHARLFGSTRFQNANHVLNVVVYSPGSLPLYPASQGYVIFFVYDDQTTPPANGNVIDFCSHQDQRLFEYAASIDNPGTAANEGGTKIMSNDIDGFMGADVPPTEAFFTQVTTMPDLDGDVIENSLDVCAFDPDNDDDTVPDQSDGTPWNPRLVTPPGDVDLDGIPAACDPNDGVPGLPAFAPRGRVANLVDNCPNHVNPDQTDSDVDGIGDACDDDDRVPNGSAQTVVNGTPLCTNGTDLDRDNYCADIDPNDTPGSGNTIVPEASAYAPQVCVDTVDNDLDTFVDLNPLETGCTDLDIDGVLNQLDNCPGIPPASTGMGSSNANPNQEDSDNDGLLGLQPYARSATDVPEGDPATFIGTPYARSDRFGGDSCDPDDDNDGLADGDDPGVCRTRSDCDSDLLLDYWEYNRSCLNITVANNASADMLPGGESSPGDGLFAYGEGVIGTDPCTDNSGPDFSQDSDGDGYKASYERYIIALASTYVPQAYSDRCGAGANPAPSIAWPSDLVSGGIPNSTDKINVTDLTSFIAPPETRRLDTSLGMIKYSRRWDLVPGKGVFANWINVTDITTLIAGSTGFPPMFGGTTKAFNGPTCTP